MNNMNGMSKKGKLCVGLVFGYVTLIVSSAGIKVSWLSVATIAFGAGVVGSLYAIYLIVQRLKALKTKE